jgi:hypothetical protein
MDSGVQDVTTGVSIGGEILIGIGHATGWHDHLSILPGARSWQQADSLTREPLPWTCRAWRRPPGVRDPVIGRPSMSTAGGLAVRIRHPSYRSRSLRSFPGGPANLGRVAPPGDSRPCSWWASF